MYNIVVTLYKKVERSSQMKAIKNVRLGGEVTDITVDGGRIVACGTPEDIARNDESVTGKYI